MSSGKTCKECGQVIPAGSPGGFCAQCLLGLGLEEVKSAECRVEKEIGLSEVPSEEGGAPTPEGEGEEPDLPDKPSLWSSHAVSAALTEKAGDRIGRYRLLQEIGHGGCGIVYMAEQEDPVRRRVALKVIKLGMDTRQVVARFEAERQALALMDHPNIARVLDAGATDSGRPYFVMEIVDGVKITDYCDRHHLATRERLHLFVQVCRAIQHAHQKGIIHRDIKPSNVLVATQDGMAMPKVIDFGIAKATQGRLTDDTAFTAFEQFLGTPAYMSPEQAQVGGLDVDTRSDIYSLGVLLYELLTGKTPFDTQEMLAAGLDGLRNTIREKEPARPSTRLSSMGPGELKTAAEQRQSDAPRLIHLVRGDLDWIVMKCLEKGRSRRYETANGLARDIERHLSQEPVIARPPSTLYMLHKFMRRNRAIASAATAISTVLVLGIAVSAWETARARRAEREQRLLVREVEAARREQTEQLWRAYLAEARALRASGQAGRRFESLSALHQAATIKPSLALRNEAIASMSLPDIQWLGRKAFDKRQKIIAPSFELYAACEPTGTVTLHRLADDREQARLPDVGAAATSVWDFSPDGRFLPVVYADGRRRVWDWAKPEVVIDVATNSAGAFTVDSLSVGSLTSNELVVHSLSSREVVNRVSLDGIGPEFTPSWLGFDPSGQWLALCGSEPGTDLLITEARTGKTLKVLPHPDTIQGAAWHPDGRHLATGCADGTMHLWDSFVAERIRVWNTRASVSLCFNHQGNLLASSGWDGYTRLWEFDTGRQVISLYRSGYHLKFSPDDQRLSSLYSGVSGATGLDLFGISFAPELLPVCEVRDGTNNDGNRPVLDRTGRYLAFRTVDGVRLWEVDTARPIGAIGLNKEKGFIGFDAQNQNLILTGSQGLFRCPLSFSGDGQALIIGAPILMSADCADPAGARIGWISRKGMLCAVVGGNRCQIFRTDTFERQSETDVQPGMRFSDISSDGALFASGAWHRSGVQVWDTLTGLLLKRLPAGEDHSDTSATVAFSPDSRCLVAATTEEYCFWDVASWSLVRRIPQEPGNDFPATMAFSPDGAIFAGTHSRNKIRLYDAATGQVLADLEAPNSKMITGLAFNHDGSRLFASESADALRVWDLRLIRRQLREMGLDWDHPQYPPADIDRERAAVGSASAVAASGGTLPGPETRATGR